jgi:PBP1b-binding outer membrane lipoprotein LpoB
VTEIGNGNGNEIKGTTATQAPVETATQTTVETATETPIETATETPVETATDPGRVHHARALLLAPVGDIAYVHAHRHQTEISCT